VRKPARSMHEGAGSAANRVVTAGELELALEDVVRFVFAAVHVERRPGLRGNQVLDDGELATGFCVESFTFITCPP